MSKTITKNRRAFHEYHVLESWDAGIVLTGTEIKSIRAGKVSLVDAHARVENGEVWLYGVQIAPYRQGNQHNHEQKRPRKLLLHKKEIAKLSAQVQEKGLTLIPLSFYFSRCWVKVNLGLCRGKKLHDKRQDLKAKDQKREIGRAMKQFDR